MSEEGNLLNGTKQVGLLIIMKAADCECVHRVPVANQLIRPSVKLRV